MGQYHIWLFILFPSYSVSHENCCGAALSITSVTKQAFDLKCRIGRGRDDPARFIWRLPFTLTLASLGTLDLPAPLEMDPSGDIAFPGHIALSCPQALLQDIIKCPGKTQTPSVSKTPSLTAHCVYHEHVFPSDLRWERVLYFPEHIFILQALHFTPSANLGTSHAASQLKFYF